MSYSPRLDSQYAVLAMTLLLVAALGISFGRGQAQTVATTSQTLGSRGSAVDAAFYLKRGEDLSGAHQYDQAIADYTTAIQLKPDYGRAKAVADFDRAIALKPDFRYAYINRANARLVSNPWLALQDFHRAGMYPERTAAILGGTVLIVIVGIVWIRRRGRRRAGGLP